MVEKTLHALTLYTIWKARPFMMGGVAFADQSRESYREQRDSLVEKLTEFAIGTQSNPTETVKRVVSNLGCCTSSLMRSGVAVFSTFDDTILPIQLSSSRARG